MENPSSKDHVIMSDMSNGVEMTRVCVVYKIYDEGAPSEFTNMTKLDIGNNMVLEVEEVNEGAQHLDNRALVGTEEIAQCEPRELDGLEEGPSFAVEAQHLDGLCVVLKVVKHHQRVIPHPLVIIPANTPAL